MPGVSYWVFSGAMGFRASLPATQLVASMIRISPLQWSEYRKALLSEGMALPRYTGPAITEQWPERGG